MQLISDIGDSKSVTDATCILCVLTCLEKNREQSVDKTWGIHLAFAAVLWTMLAILVSKPKVSLFSFKPVLVENWFKTQVQL